jgi:serine/threonine-protein kinase
MAAAVPLSAPPLEPGDLVAERYAVEARMAHGSMGAVYAATDVDLGRRVAIKVAQGRVDYQRELERRLRTEARAAGRLEGDHVARIFEFGRLPSGAPYLVMERLRGETLEDVLGREGRLDIREAVGWILQACLGLAEAHAQGIVHRDVKPENLFLAERPDGETRLKLIDFGAAAFEAKKEWQVGSVDQAAIGTLHYMAPEQLDTPPKIDARSDVWALGATLYELIAGTSPFEAEDRTVMLARIKMAEPRSLLQFRQEVNPFLDGVVLRCLEKNLANRYPDVAAFAAALSPYGPPGAHGLSTRCARVLARAGHEVGPISVPPRPPRGKLESSPLLLAITESNEDEDAVDIPVEAPRPASGPREKLESPRPEFRPPRPKLESVPIDLDFDSED